MEFYAIAVEFHLCRQVRWPDLFDGVDTVLEDWIVDQMHIVADGLTAEDILENWSKIKPLIMEERDENMDALIDLFGKVMDEWIDNDLATWIGANRFYPGVSDALKFSSSTIYIVTTKTGAVTFFALFVSRSLLCHTRTHTRTSLLSVASGKHRGYMFQSPANR